jgi:hypothetical protein
MKTLSSDARPPLDLVAPPDASAKERRKGWRSRGDLASLALERTDGDAAQ